ncbi:MAG: hypothetical protein PCFJNLEI_03629 [Verrucomicrobiae bacterium]|nr:hypothetical protein [Verrucomicrobiae bacterium]
MLRPEEFVVLPWGQPPRDLTPPDPTVVADLRECGFNLAGFIAPGDLDFFHAAGLPGIVKGDWTDKHPAAFGVYLRDEPGAQNFPDLARQVAARPHALCYINLFPNYATPAQLQAASYEEYLETFVTTVRPQFISYDHYALFEDGSFGGGYFPNLEAVRAQAVRSGLPFWNIVLSNAHYQYAEPTPAGLRLQLFTTLAYGARGISYYTYFTPPTGNYRLGPIDPDGRKSPTWFMLREVNQQLHQLGPTYVTLTSLNVFHHPNVPAGSQGLASSQWLTELTGNDLLVGEFVDPQGRPFVLVVNKSLQRSCSYHLQFRQPGQVQVVNSYTGTVEIRSGEHNWLAPGQGMLLFLQPQS